MILSELARASYAVADEMLAHGPRDAVLESTGRGLRRSVVAEVKFYAAVEEEDVFVWRDRAEWFGEVFEAVWAPDPQARGVELRGGPNDGDVVSVPRSVGPGGAFPPLRITIAHSTGPIVPGEGWPTMHSSASEYERAGIDDRARRFVYEYRP